MREPVIGLDIEATVLDSIVDKIRLVTPTEAKGTWVIDTYHVPTGGVSADSLQHFYQNYPQCQIRCCVLARDYGRSHA